MTEVDRLIGMVNHVVYKSADEDVSKFDAALATLRAELEALVMDKERIDALQSAQGNNQWIVAQGPGSFTVSLLRRGIESFATRKTIREAIDAAREVK